MVCVTHYLKISENYACILIYIYLKEQNMLHACFLQTNANGRAIPGPIIAFMVNII